MRFKHHLVASCATLLFAVPAFAQTPTDAAPQASSADSGDIVVTARRREESLQDVPIAVSAISGAQLQKSGVTDVQGLQYRTPSLTITSGQSQRNTVAFAIRGQRTQETQLFTDPPVGTYFGEVVQPRPDGFGKSFYDLESVQVLKGVQGTLFGRNMTGGAVLVEPAHPKLGDFSGEVRVQYGNYNMHDIYGMLNIPLTETLAVRVSGVTHQRDGWAKDVSGLRLDDQNYNTFRVSALWEPTDRISSMTVFDWYNSNEKGTASFLTTLDPTSRVVQGYQAIGVDLASQFAQAQALFQQHPYTLNMGAGKGGPYDFFGGPFEKINNWGVQNKTTFDISDDLKLKNIAGYRKLHRYMVQDYDGIPATLIAPYQFSRSENISEELQLQGKAFDSKLEYIVGAYYFEEKGLDGSLANTLPQLALVNPASGITSTAQNITDNTGRGYSRTAAGFVAGTFHVTDKISLSGGLRYNYDKRKITVGPNRPYQNGGTCVFNTDPTLATFQTVPIGQCSFTNSATFKEWTYDATAQYEPSSHVTTYFSYRHGFRAGGFSTRAANYPALNPFLPEFVNEYELGLKTNSRFGNVRLTTATSLFRQDGSDVQKQRATFDPSANNVYTIVDNTAAQRNQGGEFEATLSVPTFNLTGFYSFTKVEILQGAGQLIGANGQVFNEIAQRGVPKHQVGLTATMSPPVAESLGQLNVVANWTWRSTTWLDDYEVQGRQKPYSLINLRAELNNINHTGLSVAAFVNNALNERYRIGVLGLIAEGLGIQNSVYGEPRMFGGEVSYKF